jgi:hypothetical protein
LIGRMVERECVSDEQYRTRETRTNLYLTTVILVSNVVLIVGKQNARGDVEKTPGLLWIQKGQTSEAENKD